MTEQVHLVCDRCDLDTVNDVMKNPASGWVTCSGYSREAGIQQWHFCPACWKGMMAKGATPATVRPPPNFDEPS